MLKTGIVLLGALGLLAGCTTPRFTMPPGPQAYRNGYYDGCGAGYAVAGSPFYKTIDTAEPPSADKLYRIGWEDGFLRCKRNYQRIQRVVNSVLGPPL